MMSDENAAALSSLVATRFHAQTRTKLEQKDCTQKNHKAGTSRSPTLDITSQKQQSREKETTCQSGLFFACHESYPIHSIRASPTMKYAHVVGNEVSDDSHNTQDDSVSLASSHRRFGRHKRINSELSEPLTTSASTSIVDEELGSTAGDPYFVFRSDLQKKLELVDESLADYLRIVHETVCFF
jgi:hypothetical protein